MQFVIENCLSLKYKKQCHRQDYPKSVFVIDRLWLVVVLFWVGACLVVNVSLVYTSTSQPNEAGMFVKWVRMQEALCFYTLVHFRGNLALFEVSATNYIRSLKDKSFRMSLKLKWMALSWSSSFGGVLNFINGHICLFFYQLCYDVRDQGCVVKLWVNLFNNSAYLFQFDQYFLFATT